MTAVDSGSVNPDEYKILEDLNLDPIISFRDLGETPSEFVSGSEALVAGARGPAIGA